ncbi:fungal-specific transcription factor domain-containing protein, partial [Mycena vitilis]
GGAGGTAKEKAVRRRSSKACDQCRKSKCKCERPGPGEPCRSCVVLGTECTSLGPSRKRGPPKGYIDAIEARLHQTEALVGILLAAANYSAASTVDDRARALLSDLAEDPLARAILARIDQSAYGPGARRAAAGASPASSNHSPIPNGTTAAKGGGDLASTHPSHEWMDRVTAHILRRGRASNSNDPRHPTAARVAPTPHPAQCQPAQHPAPAPRDHHRAPAGPGLPPTLRRRGRRERRRRKCTDDAALRGRGDGRAAVAPTRGRRARLDVDVPSASPAPRGERYAGGGEGYRARDREGQDRSLAEGLAGAVGQLSLNEDKQVRYHGKVSGLHLLARREPLDGDLVSLLRRFPKARVWPAAPADDDYGSSAGEADADGLPPRAAQEELLARYFAHVHPSFPVVHKRAVLEAWARGEGCVHLRFRSLIGLSKLIHKNRRPPPLLLLAMYALAARHAPQPPSSSLPDAPSQYMWPAGDAYLFRAKGLLDSSYASSRASTCQALLLMGFREIGIGAMAQAWIYIGMAVRMAQDLGMQRGAEDGMTGQRGEDGKLFGVWEIAERRRIWYACVIMDKYVSTYIGRPLAIFERDFDTSLPSESDLEEMEEWVSPADAPLSFSPRAGRVISCFNESARLAGILSQIVQSIYALRPAGSRHAELVVLDGQLDRWRLALPAHLHHDPARSTRGGGVGEVPLPQVLTLHMQYWCAVLLLHRPLCADAVELTPPCSSPAPEEGDVRRNAEQNYELCASAANHITTIATLYSETYTLMHCAVFLCYYIFTASIMHVTSLSAYPTDPQARLGLAKCMDALKQMDIVWPAAGRAFELLRGAQANLADAEADPSGGRNSSTLVSRITRKRSATHTLDDSFAPTPGSESFLPLRQFAQGYSANGHYSHETRSPVAYYPPSASPYERWPAEDGGALPFQGAVLSTAVLGPAYSTGLVDDRRPPPVHEGEPRFGQPQQQYWNDYAAFPPGLGPVYGELHDPALAVHAEPHYPLHEFSLYNQNHHGHGP